MGRQKQNKTVEDWVQDSPAALESDIREAWESGYRYFKKFVIKPGQVLDDESGEYVGGMETTQEPMPMDYPVSPKEGEVLVLAKSFNGREWSWVRPGPTVEGGSPALLKILADIVSRDGPRKRLMDRGHKIISEHLPEWLAHGTDEEKRRASEIHDFLAFAIDMIGESMPLKGVFCAGIEYARMTDLHLDKGDGMEKGWRVVARFALQNIGDYPASELAQKMGALTKDGEWIFPDGQKCSDSVWRSAVTNAKEK